MTTINDKQLESIKEIVKNEINGYKNFIAENPEAEGGYNTFDFEATLADGLWVYGKVEVYFDCDVYDTFDDGFFDAGNHLTCWCSSNKVVEISNFKVESVTIYDEDDNVTATF